MYKVIVYFTDVKDGGHPYNVGEVYPREGLTVSAERLAELSGTKNKRGVALIEEVKEPAKAEEPKEAPKKAVTVKKQAKKKG